MARVTVEDCLQHVENRFVLVLEAAERAHQLELSGAEPKVPPDNDKPTVIALREIAAGYHFSEEGVKATLKAPVKTSAAQASKDLLGESVE